MKKIASKARNKKCSKELLAMTIDLNKFEKLYERLASVKWMEFFFLNWSKLVEKLK